MVFEIIGNDLNLIKESKPEPYRLEFYERESLDEIKRCIKNHFYHDRKTVMEHIEFLDHLAIKLQSAVQLEMSYGESSPEAKKDLVEVNSLKSQLAALANQFT